MSGNELATKGQGALDKVSFDDVVITRDDIRAYLCPKATDKDIFMALGIMASLKLNPFKNEVHLIKYGDAPAEVVVGYQVYLKRAARFKDADGKAVLKGWKVGVNKENSTAWLKIWRSDWTEVFEWEVNLLEFSKKQATWNQIPSFMGKKVAIAQGFRMCFADDEAGIAGLPYTPEEVAAYDVIDENAKPPKTVPAVKSKDEAAAQPEFVPAPGAAAPAGQAPATPKPAVEPGACITVRAALALEDKDVVNIEGVFCGMTDRQVGKDNKTVYDYTLCELNPAAGEKPKYMAVSSWTKYDKLVKDKPVEALRVSVKDIHGNLKYTANGAIQALILLGGDNGKA